MSTLSNPDLLSPDEPSTMGWQTLGSMTGYSREAHALVLTCGASKLRLSFERAGIVRVRLAPDGIFGRDHSWAVVPDESTAHGWKIDDENGHLTVITSTVRVVIKKDPCRVSFYSLDGEFIAGHHPGKAIAWEGDDVRCWMQMRDDDHFFGLGERGLPLDKRGQVLVNWNHDAAEHDPWTDPLYQSHPFAIVFNKGKAHGIFFDNTFRATFDLGKTSTDAYSFGADGGEMNYYFIPGPTAKDVIRRYAALVGGQAMPPLWALGYQQCRWSYESAKRARDIAKRLRKNRIPCDTIYLDIDYMDGFRCFTWDADRFKNPQKLLRDLSEDGFRTVVILDPGLKKEPGYFAYDSGLHGHHFCIDGDTGQPYVGKVWPGESVYPDFTRASTRKWWGDLYKGLVEDGIAGFWNDMNEPADFTFPTGTVPMSMRHDNDGKPTDHRECHNVYGMQMARSTNEGVRKLRPNERPFVLTRAGYAGVQRYGAVWTGDNLSSWEHLRMSIPMVLNMGLSGLVFSGADIGGFRGHPSPELFTRWLQLGIFYPLCRVHTCGGLAKDAPEQDPTSFGKRFIPVNREAIELRYRLLPYLYTQMNDAERTGLPVMRPLMLDFPEHEKVHRCEYDFMWGDQIYVAPVVEEKAKVRRMKLPAGTWYEFEAGNRFEGGEELTLKVRLETIPMFARAGAIIPMREVVQFTGEKPLNELILAIYPGSGRGTYYNDDGISYRYEDGAYTREHYRVDSDESSIRFRVAEREGVEDFAPPYYLLQFKAIEKSPERVSQSGQALVKLKKKDAGHHTEPGWWYDKETNTLSVRVPRLTADENVDVTLKA